MGTVKTRTKPAPTRTRLESIIATRLIHYEGQNAILGIVTDITNRKRGERMLQMLNSGQR